MMIHQIALKYFRVSYAHTRMMILLCHIGLFWGIYEDFTENGWIY